MILITSSYVFLYIDRWSVNVELTDGDIPRVGKIEDCCQAVVQRSDVINVTPLRFEAECPLSIQRR